MAHDLHPYKSPQARDDALRDFAQRAGAHVEVLGHSVQGREILGAHFPCHDKAAPHVLVCANLHGVEFIGAEVALGVAQVLNSAQPRVLQLRQNAHVWVIPCMNPDGYLRTWTQRGHGSLKQLRCNAHGVDLNRNYPAPGAQPVWALSMGGWATGSRDQTNAFYRGAEPLSEPETAMLDALHRRHSFLASVNVHSTMGTIFPAHVKDRHSFKTYKRLTRALREAQPHWAYRPLSSRVFDWFTGEQEDFQHHTHGCWAVCLETFTLKASRAQQARHARLFWRFNPKDPEPWVRNDVSGILGYLLAALDVGYV